MKISGWTPIGSSILRGCFKVTLPSGMVVSCTLCQKADGTRWVNPPQRAIKGNGDKVRYERLVGFVDRDTSDRFNAAVLAALDEHLGSAA